MYLNHEYGSATQCMILGKSHQHCRFCFPIFLNADKNTCTCKNRYKKDCINASYRIGSRLQMEPSYHLLNSHQVIELTSIRVREEKIEFIDAPDVLGNFYKLENEKE